MYTEIKTISDEVSVICLPVMCQDTAVNKTVRQTDCDTNVQPVNHCMGDEGGVD